MSNKIEKIIDELATMSIDSKCREEANILINACDILSECNDLIYGIAAMGYLVERFDSGQTHKELCMRFDKLDK